MLFTHLDKSHVDDEPNKPKQFIHIYLLPFLVSKCESSIQCQENVVFVLVTKATNH